jgi:membrane-bound ClpP family serine protease
MEENKATTDRHESTGIALSGLILGIIALICALLPNWRSIGLVIGIAALLVSAFSLYKTKKTGARPVRAITGLILAILAIAVASYFKFQIASQARAEEEEENAIPAEFHDTTVLQEDHNNALEKLQGLTDSTKAQ